MRRHMGTDDIDLPNAAEIEAALNAAIDRPLDDLLSIEEFAEKYAPPAPAAAITADTAALRGEDDVDQAPETLPLPLPTDAALPKAA